MSKWTNPATYTSPNRMTAVDALESVFIRIEKAEAKLGKTQVWEPKPFDVEWERIRNPRTVTGT